MTYSRFMDRLVLWLPMTEGAGLRLNDLSKYHNNGVFGPGSGHINNEAFTSVFDTPVQLDHTNLTPGTTVVTDNGVTFDEGPADDYTMDNEAGTITVLSTGAMADATGYFIDYDYSGSYPTWVTGRDGLPSVRFDSVDDYIAIAHSASLAVGTTVTYGCWFTLSRAVETDELIFLMTKYGGFTGARITLKGLEGANTRITWTVGDGTVDTVHVDTELAGGVPYFVVGTAKANDAQIVYLDGTLMKEETCEDILDTGGVFIISHEIYTMPGTIDGAFAYNRIVDPYEVRSAFEAARKI